MISNLPVATKEDDAVEAAALRDEKEMASKEVQSNQDVISSEGTTEEESDPFGLDALISNKPKKDEKGKDNKGKEEEEMMRFLKLQREALINCLEIAAKRYKIPWLVFCTPCNIKQYLTSFLILVLTTMNIFFAGVRLLLTYW